MDDNQFFIELAKKMGLKIPGRPARNMPIFGWLAWGQIPELEAINYISFPEVMTVTRMIALNS